MIAPLGGIGVVAPVPDNGLNCPGSAHSRGALDRGDACNLPHHRDLAAATSTLTRRAAIALAQLVRFASRRSKHLRQRRICHV